jgi:hypothetical protein
MVPYLQNTRWQAREPVRFWRQGSRQGEFIGADPISLKFKITDSTSFFNHTPQDYATKIIMETHEAWRKLIMSKEKKHAENISL